MAEIGSGLKSVFMKSMEAVNKTASNIAVNTKYKIDEMNLLNKRHEIISDFGTKAYQLWQKGEDNFPDELKSMLCELSRVDEAINTLRAERVMASSEAQNQPEETPSEEASKEKMPGEEMPETQKTEENPDDLQTAEDDHLSSDAQQQE